MENELNPLKAPIILAVDTATLGGSVSLIRGDSILVSRIGEPAISHSNSLLRDINSCLEEAAVKLQDIDLFAAASGPGSFTGLRIGLATVKALSRTLGRPCAGVPTLHAVAHAAGPSSATVGMLPAGRGEVFVQLLSVSADDSLIELDTAAHLPPRKVLEMYGSMKPLKWAGEGAHLHRLLLIEYAQEKGIEFTEGESAQPSRDPAWILSPREDNLSKHVALLALWQLESGHVIQPDSLRAIYVRPSDAELK
ncbi:MAG TPA: tRNA (adenosine(37)-N6)-threonylcarbamoyltransferase complex dimerization subunit type 1 TsaB [Pyrinomonadaceae bacterium]|nr:tRNA (adenosine(37)-N6)-threonylcarbamoyltransferase complex dimerization subunit type 1 TsaB [Pyrinomonadaceae bacterium]